MTPWIRCLLSLALATGFLVACNHRTPTSQQMLRLSMIPTNDPGKMLRDSTPLIAYLEKKTGAKVQMTIPTSYAAVVEAIAAAAAWDRQSTTTFSLLSTREFQR